MDRPPATASTSRRTLLKRGALTLVPAVALAGCTSDVGEELPGNEHWPVSGFIPDLPIEQRHETMAARIEEFAAADIRDIEGFVAVFEDRGVAFESVEEVADQLHLEYVEPDPEERGFLHIFGAVAGAYASLVDAGVEPRALELVLFETDGSTIGVGEIATDWASAYNEGDFSAAAYGEHVITTVESRREPPEPGVEPEE